MPNIDRRLAELEAATDSRKPVILVCTWGAEAAEVEAAHFARYPEDRGRLLVMVQTGVPRSDDAPNIVSR